MPPPSIVSIRQLAVAGASADRAPTEQTVIAPRYSASGSAGKLPA
jgi:hypothetical protein